MNQYWYCGIAVKGLKTVYSYISDEGEIPVGSYVEVPFGATDTLRIGIVKSCAEYPAEEAPYPVDRTKHIIRLATAEEYEQQPPVQPFYSFENDHDDDYDDIDYFIEEEEWDEVLDWAEEHHDTENRETIQKVIRCYELCMEHNMPAAALNLGTFYYEGRFVEQDYKRAFELYKIAADAGEQRAICNCGYCFYYGRHGDVDYKEAYKYYSLGALLFEDANCLYKLGDMYLNGYGVEQNEAYAYMLYKRSLERSEMSWKDSYATADAQIRVAKCLLRGIGTSEDVEKAHGLLCLALMNYYKRRKTDPYVFDLIKRTKDLMSEAEMQLK